MDAVVADDHFLCGVELDAGDVVASELPFEGDVVDVVVLNGGEHTQPRCPTMPFRPQS
jgi:hypothetical protein